MNTLALEWVKLDRTERFYKIDQLLNDRMLVPIQDFLDELGVSLATFNSSFSSNSRISNYGKSCVSASGTTWPARWP